MRRSIAQLIAAFAVISLATASPAVAQERRGAPKKDKAKKAAAVQWCRHATAHAATYSGKPWRYVLIPHDVIAENMTLEVLARQIGVE